MIKYINRQREKWNGMFWYMVANLIAVVAVLVITAIAAMSPPAFEYTGTKNGDGIIEYQPEVAEICPGDLLIYTPNIHIARIGEAITIRLSIYDLDQHGTIWSRDIDINTHEKIASVAPFPLQLPDDVSLLRPGGWRAGGNYQLMSNATVSGGDAYVVNFSIATDCE